MGSEGEEKVEMFFFPDLQGGHFLAMMDTARIFAAAGAKVTFITTPSNAELFKKTIQRDQNLGREISFHTIELPNQEIENFHSVTTVDMGYNLFVAARSLKEPFEDLLRQRRPDCFVSDASCYWTADIGVRLGIPRISFYMLGLFPICCDYNIRKHEPHKNVGSDSDPFVLPGLPDLIELTKRRLPTWFKTESNFTQFMERVAESQESSYGSLFNSCHELESGYAEYYKKVMGRDKLWLVGPVCLFNKNADDMADRGQTNSAEEQTIVNWLNSKSPNSVLYICFGSQPHMDVQQFHELAHGLESSGQSFIWVPKFMARSSAEEVEQGNQLLPEGFEQRVTESGKGLILRGWAPQLLILNHPSVGGFMTHTGWNSLVEGISAGVPLITWPLTFDQFYNECFAVDVLNAGIRVGNEDWTYREEPRKMLVTREMVAAAVKKVMAGCDESVIKMRENVEELSGKVKKALDVGGSSYADAIALIEELKSRRSSDKN